MIRMNKEYVDKVHLYHKQARQYVDLDPNSAVAKCRVIGEIILGQVLEKEEKRSPRGITLDQLIGQTKQHLPSKIEAHCNVIRLYGNFGSHFRMDEEISPAVVNACLLATSELIEWFDPEHNSLDSEPVHVEVEEEINEKEEDDFLETVRNLMHKMVEEKKLTLEDNISLREIKEWFMLKNTGHKENTVTAHVQMMTTNGEARLSHELAKDGSDELFFRIRKGLYRLYNRDLDPEPITEYEQFSGWENNLLLVNTTKSLEIVKESMIYLSPNKSGNYKLRRSKFIGLYQDKSIKFIGEIIGKVTFRNENSKGWVWWKNVDIDEKELVKKTYSRVHFDDRSDWVEPFPVQAIVFRNIMPVDFKTEGRMQNNNRVFPVKGANNIDELFELINGKTWEEWLN